MVKMLRPAVAEFFKDFKQNLKMIILLISHRVDKSLYIIIRETPHGSSQILRDIDRSPIPTKEKFFIQAFIGKVAPYRAIFFGEENAFVQTFFYQIFTQKVSLAFILNLVKIYSKAFISFRKSCINPSVHFFPKVSYFFIAIFPVQKHFLSL